MMENKNPQRYKRIPENPAETLDLDCRKTKKRNLNQDPSPTESEISNANLSDSLNDKMTNIAKLRKQFIQESKDVEIALKQTIENLKQKIIDAKKKDEAFSEKLRESNQELCNQAQEIYEKEQAYETLSEKVREFYDCQKELIDNMEGISDTLNSHDHLSNVLNNQFDSIKSVLDANTKVAEQKLLNISFEENLINQELEKMNLKITGLDQEIYESEKRVHQLEAEFKAAKDLEETDKKILMELDKKENEAQLQIQEINRNRDKEKNILVNDTKKLIQDINLQDEKSKKLDDQIAELNKNIEINKNNEIEIQKKITLLNEEINMLLTEEKQIDEVQYVAEQENSIQLEKLKEELNIFQNELKSAKQNETQVFAFLLNKISEYKEKLKNFDAIKEKVEKYEKEIKKEEELITKSKEQCEIKKSEFNNKIKLMNDKLVELQTNKKFADSKLNESQQEFNIIQKEYNEINKKLKDNSLTVTSKKQQSILGVKDYGLQNLFPSEVAGYSLKLSNKKAYYQTPILGDDDLGIDSLPIEEQFNKLTQGTNSIGDKREKKFFKSSTPRLSQSANLSQGDKEKKSSKLSTSVPKPKRESTRGKGRGKKSCTPNK